MLNNLSLQVRSSTSNDELDRRYQCYKLQHPRSPPFNLSLGCESWGVRGGGEQLQHEHDHLRPRTLQSGQSTYQKIFYIHWQSTIRVLSSSAHQRVPIEYYYERMWNV